MEWTFGTVLWSMLVFFFWLAFLWIFISIFADILRRDLSGWAKAGWITLIVLLDIHQPYLPDRNAEDDRRGPPAEGATTGDPAWGRRRLPSRRDRQGGPAARRGEDHGR